MRLNSDVKGITVMAEGPVDPDAIENLGSEKGAALVAPPRALDLALMEEIQVANGEVLNPSFTDYLIPTILDIPPMTVDVLELADPNAPYGVRGVGEPPHHLVHAGDRGCHPRGDRLRRDPHPGAVRPDSQGSEPNPRVGAELVLTRSRDREAQRRIHSVRAGVLTRGEDVVLAGNSARAGVP